jgi:hypothetical protein
MVRRGRRKHKCLCCNSWFSPDPRRRGEQRYCSRTQCQRASKTASQRRWLRKSENQRYFQGPEHVERVQRWRRAHPRYWRRKRDRQYRPLQDVIDTQVLGPKGDFGDLNGALQDVMVTVPRQRLERQVGNPSPRSGVGRVEQTGPASCK